MENKIIELLRKNRIGKEKAVYLAHELLFLLGAVERSKQLCECKKPKSDGWYGDAYMCKCGKIYIEE